MISRWEIAQKFEPDHWIKQKSIIKSEEYRAKIKNRSKTLQKNLAKYIDLSDRKNNILEIGGGATQLIDYFPGGNKYAVDPLANIYLKEFRDILNPNVSWSNSKAEKLSFDDDFFDLIVARNVLDHVDSLENVLFEIRRSIKTGGIIYFGTNVFSGILYLYRMINKDKEHPYTFRKKSLNEIILSSGFCIIDSIVDSPEQMTHFKELESKGYINNLLRNLFLSMKNYHFYELILKKL